jgi:hypothetical protein
MQQGIFVHPVAKLFFAIGDERMHKNVARHVVVFVLITHERFAERDGWLLYTG